MNNKKEEKEKKIKEGVERSGDTPVNPFYYSLSLDRFKRDHWA